MGMATLGRRVPAVIDPCERERVTSNDAVTGVLMLPVMCTYQISHMRNDFVWCEA